MLHVWVESREVVKNILVASLLSVMMLLIELYFLLPNVLGVVINAVDCRDKVGDVTVRSVVVQ